MLTFLDKGPRDLLVHLRTVHKDDKEAQAILTDFEQASGSEYGVEVVANGSSSNKGQCLLNSV
jgi:hypothetical protein